jgi:GNAT superfamily N-acetyltransferase/2-polyprenyl-3-methyl-5-hydroxy-6-metoxy-1,4-benzoquinol methylase
MSTVIEFRTGHSNQEQVAAHLRVCDGAFVPPLSSRVNVGDYAEKIAAKACRFEAWVNGGLAGLVAAYCNAQDKGKAFITSVSILPGWQGQGIASQLMEDCITYLRGRDFALVELEVTNDNTAAIALYRKHGFAASGTRGPSIVMTLDLDKGMQMNPQRDYNAEIRDTADRQYAYSFDFDVMHHYMIRSFEPFFRLGSLLELGSFKGDFTRRLLDRFEDVTCVEASSEAIAEAKRKLGDRASFIHSAFEVAALPRRYDNIVMTHVLEHLDDPIRILKRVNEEWLSEGGRFFLVCPNANAPSRQIAVKMGLIADNASVTAAEAEHGHRRTYSLDTLEREAVAGGLKVVCRSGIFFKALANFQWDRLLSTDIISEQYLEGCYALGQQYPDLCASIFLMCEAGD